MVIEHLFPVFFLLAMGVVFKQTGFTTESFLRTTDRLIYYIFFPILLFWKIGGAEQQFSAQALRFYVAAGIAVLAMYGITLLIIRLTRMSAVQAGAFSQSCYRFNTYVGVAVILSVFGETGVAQFGVLIGLLIPPINVLAVTTLIWFDRDPQPASKQTGVILRALLRNPLILGCLGGLVYAALFSAFPPMVDNTLRLTTSVTLPLALLSIGGSLTLHTVRDRFRVAMAATLMKQAGLPLLGWAMLRLFGVDGLQFQIGMIFFALPTSTAMYVLCSQHHSDTILASAIIVLSTVLSFVSLSIVLAWV
jgi:predicted permease